DPTNQERPISLSAPPTPLLLDKTHSQLSHANAPAPSSERLLTRLSIQLCISIRREGRGDIPEPRRREAWNSYAPYQTSRKPRTAPRSWLRPSISTILTVNPIREDRDLRRSALGTRHSPPSFGRGTKTIQWSTVTLCPI